jgi:predicted signal transduction protein with EAL and GGDEF domain
MRASIGIALGRHPQDTPVDLLRDADLAMYLAKEKGDGRFEMYRTKMHTDALFRVETAAEIRRGLETGQFVVFYQPIVNARAGTLIGTEALVRWNHPTRGLLGPDEGVRQHSGLPLFPASRRGRHCADLPEASARPTCASAGRFLAFVLTRT